MIRVVCTTPVQQQQVRQICADPSIKVSYHAAATDAVEEQQDIASARPARTLSEYSASTRYGKSKPIVVVQDELDATEAK